MALLTQDRLRQTRAISRTFEQTRFDSFEKSARELHLRGVLGDELYTDLIANPNDAKYVTLLNGETYVKDGRTITFFGVLEYLCYAWLFINSVEGDDFQSNIGTVNFNQQNQFTQRPGGKSHTLNLYQRNMVEYKNNIIDYLDAKRSIYPLWEGNRKDNSSKFMFMSI